MMNHPVVSLFLVLPAIADIVDEQKVGKEKALEILSNMLGDSARHPHVEAAINRLRDSIDELEFRVRVGEEGLKAMEESYKYD